MSYRRSIAARANLFYQHQHRISPSISNIHRRDNESEELQTKSDSRYPEIQNYIQHRFSVTGDNYSNYRRPKSVLQDRRFAVPAGYGMVHSRNYSSASVEGGAADKIEVLNNVVGVLNDTAVEAAPALSEVAVAAADSSAPVASLQYLIDYVHCFTGFDWWASLVVTTIIIRCVQLPFIINQVKASTKLTILRPQMEALNEEMEKKGNPKAYAEGQAKMKALFKEYNVSPFTPLKGVLVSAPVFCCFYLAINNMVAKVPSFADGGILWFTNLSTPDSFYILPVLNGLAFWALVECNAQEGMAATPHSATIKNVQRAFAAVSVPLTGFLPTAVFCYWLPSTMYSLAFGLAIKNPVVKKFLGIPDLPPPPPNQKPPLTFRESVKKVLEYEPKFLKDPPASARAPLKSMDDSPPPHLRFRSLEKKVKGRKTGKKK